VTIYKWLWTRLGGRPWSDIIRDTWRQFEFFWIVGLVTLGVCLGHIFDWQRILLIWLIFSLGYLCGHLFW